MFYAEVGQRDLTVVGAGDGKSGYRALRDLDVLANDREHRRADLDAEGAARNAKFGEEPEVRGDVGRLDTGHIHGQ